MRAYHVPKVDTATLEEVYMNKALTDLIISQWERWLPKQKQGDQYNIYKIMYL